MTDLVTIQLTQEEKKSFLLLMLMIFNYHGFDDNEKKILAEHARRIGATDELDWAYTYFGDDYFNSFEKVKGYFNETLSQYSETKKIHFLQMVWDATILKGYISEMEATAMLRLAKEWGVQKQFLDLIRKK